MCLSFWRHDDKSNRTVIVLKPCKETGQWGLEARGRCVLWSAQLLLATPAIALPDYSFPCLQWVFPC